MQGSKWFGGLCGSKHGGEILPHWLRELRMTATAIMYTSSGFAIASDGRQRWQHGPTRDRATRNAESDKTQKIFPIEFGRTALAYVVTGDTVNRDRSFDIAVEVGQQASMLRRKWFVSCRGFVRIISARLEQVIEDAKRSGKLEDYPSTEISFAGYRKTTPYWETVLFYRRRNHLGSLYEITSRQITPGSLFFTGSPPIMDLILREDDRVATFARPIRGEPSLQAALNFTKGYIEACSSPSGREIDSERCQGIGGHIHIATVTSCRSAWFRKEGGFQWVIPPLSGSHASSVAS